MFGRTGLDGLKAIVAGCPALAHVSAHLTVGAIHYLGTHCPALKECNVLRLDKGAGRYVGIDGWAPPEFSTCEELQTLYPAVEWFYTHALCQVSGVTVTGLVVVTVKAGLVIDRLSKLAWFPLQQLNSTPRYIGELHIIQTKSYLSFTI